MAAHTSNRFALLASAPTKQPQPRALKDKSTVQAQKAQVAQELKNIKQEEKTQVDDQNKGAGRGPRGQNQNNNRGPRREGQDNRGPREGRQGGQDNRGPRKFDRRSGTGRPANEEKKGGHGKQNWGTVTDAVAASGEQPEAERPEGEQPDQETPKVEEEPKTFTLAEYEQQLAENLVKLDRPPPRVVEEDDVLKSKYVKVEKKHETFVPGKPKKNKDNKSTQKKQVIPVSQILDIKQNDSRPQGNRGGRGGKNQNRGPRGQQQQTFNLDESAFPKLG